MNNSIFINNLSNRFILMFSHQVSTLIAIIILGNRLDTNSFGLVSIHLILFQISFIITEWGFSIFALQNSNEKGDDFLNFIFSKPASSIILCISFFEKRFSKGVPNLSLESFRITYKLELRYQ